MSMSTVEVIDRGMRCLSNNLGAGEAELLISTILRERFDYTEWRRTFIDDIDSFEKLDDFVENSKKTLSFNGSPDCVI